MRDGGYARRRLADGGLGLARAEGVDLPSTGFAARMAIVLPADGVRACTGGAGHVVSWFEADAYARWAGKRLPTEAEWEFAAAYDPMTARSRRYPWGDDPAEARLPDCELRNWAVRAPAAWTVASGTALRAFRGMAGGVWEWTCVAVPALSRLRGVSLRWLLEGAHGRQALCLPRRLLGHRPPHPARQLPQLVCADLSAGLPGNEVCAMIAAMIELKGVSKRYGDAYRAPSDRPGDRAGQDDGADRAERLRQVDAAAPDRRPDRADAGHGRVRRQRRDAGNTARTLRRRMGYVIQDGGLFPHLTAEQNVLLMARHLEAAAEADAGSASTSCAN